MEHKDIPDAQLHQIKGAASAASGQVPIATGSGTATFGFLDYSQVLNTPEGGGYERIMLGYSAANQEPSALNTPIVINFGAAQSTTDVSLSAGGVLTFNTPGNYLVSLFLRLGRTGSIGNAILLHRVRLNGVPVMNSNGAFMASVAETLPYYSDMPFSVEAGDTLDLQMVRDPAGSNDGGARVIAVTATGWDIVPSAMIIVYKFNGGA